MENFCRHWLLAVARKFAKARGLTIATVSRKAHGAAHFLEAFERGEISVTLSQYDKMMGFFEREWPDGTAWPAAPRGTVKVLRKFSVKSVD